jgi:hypothetical protein
MNTFPETELTLHVDTWWVHPLADSTDKYTCAFILLRRQLVRRPASQILRNLSLTCHPGLTACRDKESKQKTTF